MKPTYQSGGNKDPFASLQKEAMHIYKKSNRKQLNRIALFNGLIFLCLFLMAMILYWTHPENIYIKLIAATAMGILSVPLVLVIGHEAIHGNFTDVKNLNRWGCGIFYILGTSPYFWKLRHIYAHHHFTNVRTWDLDIEQSRLIRLEADQPYHKFHKFQHLYMPVLFLCYTLNWFFFRDFKDIRKVQFGSKQIEKHPAKYIIYLLLAKCWHVMFLLFIPVWMGHPVLEAVASFLIFHFTASLTTTLVLVSTHIGAHQELIPTQHTNALPYSWSEHQIRTSGDFSTDHNAMLHFFGGFNHHLAHHLFPNIPYALYPQITPKIKNYCESSQLPYHHYNNLFSCIRSHFIRLQQYSKP